MSSSCNLGLAVAIGVVVAAVSGCSTYRNTVPGYCVGDSYQESRSDKEPINFLRLRQEPPEAYRLDARDVMGIYIEGVLGTKEEPPPVHFPEDGENLPPSIGYPIPVREDGTISLPLVGEINVRGLTLQEAEKRVRETYITKKILKPERERIIVTLMQPRTYHILVVREDQTTDTRGQLFGGLGSSARSVALAMQLGQTSAGMSYPIELKAYENDVLHALSETGGLPGTDAKNEVIILRAAFSTEEERDYLLSCMHDPQYMQQQMGMPNVVKIPLRVGPNDPVVELSERDIILNRGDMVFVRSRESEVFYTGGLLPSGQWPIPRDYDIDVFQAMALAGGNIGSGFGSTDTLLNNGGGSSSGICPATRVIILRELCGEQVAIEVSLRRGMSDPAERIRILPGDFIVLEYTRSELCCNMAMSFLRFNFLFGGGR